MRSELPAPCTSSPPPHSAAPLMMRMRRRTRRPPPLTSMARDPFGPSPPRTLVPIPLNRRVAQSSMLTSASIVASPPRLSRVTLIPL
eukprot:scaffold665_cov77-Phaeocystis_antarctica.AAC.1